MRLLIQLATLGNWSGVENILDGNGYRYDVDAIQDEIDPTTGKRRQGRHTTMTLALITLRCQDLNKAQVGFMNSVIAKLLLRGANADYAPWGEVKGVGRTTAMHLGAGHLPYWLFVEMFNCGGDIFQIDSLGSNLLHWAALGDPKTLEFLLPLGLDTQKVNQAGRTPLQNVEFFGSERHQQIIESYLRSRGSAI